MRAVSVRFGGIHAVDDVTLDVAEGELVGLIGTNGAGKSTLMNAIGGFVPAIGSVHVLGVDVSGEPSYRRHRHGLGRGFQAARLFPALTVRETIMVALEARERSWLLPSMTGLPPSPAAERRKRSEAAELIDFLGLGRYGDEFVSNLSTGTRRIVELGTLLAVDARVLLLDEPTGGVAEREAEAFGPLIVRIQRELGAAMLVIEHDMPLIMGISDRVYCLEAGAVIAEGAPSAVRGRPSCDCVVLGHGRTRDPTLGRDPTALTVETRLDPQVAVLQVDRAYVSIAARSVAASAKRRARTALIIRSTSGRRCSGRAARSSVAVWTYRVTAAWSVASNASGSDTSARATVWPVRASSARSGHAGAAP